jgi:hypothetical protein
MENLGKHAMIEPVKNANTSDYSSAHGFYVHNCTEHFYVEIGQRKTLFISFLPDFSASLVQRELFLYTSQGLVVLPVIAKFGSDQLALCNKYQV